MLYITIKSNLQSGNINCTEYLNSQRERKLFYFRVIFNFKKFSRGCEERVRRIGAEGGGELPRAAAYSNSQISWDK
jgi:hypothetical protein